MELANVLVNVTELLLAALTIADLRTRVHFHVRHHRLWENHEATKRAFHTFSRRSDDLVIEDVPLEEPVADLLVTDFALNKLRFAVHSLDVITHSQLGMLGGVTDVALKLLVFVRH